ncbi:hypothetical protein BZG35_05645 [Brevundimonas sp. LM2]|uniref:metallophosphoesterase family protein n=1 Tax=Brevundimonas sp. LM2 TaxID=1938605 RepID=UPI000983C928|nr:metallophosphoesterase family protein [Brevundimonas sp. LM2]AQR61191.1 hypothetical protein BZG35_05645 [Brevundimonas sp. LM2]
MFGRKKNARKSTGGRLVYAIGDVHGRDDLLEAMLKEIDQDSAHGLDAVGDKAILIFLGDYVDRGRQSREVIDRVIALQREGTHEVHALKGNHEEAFLRFLEDASFGRSWTLHGGAETLTSYGVKPPGMRADDEAWTEAHAAFMQALPAAHRTFLETLELSASVGDYLFVHAGIRPGVKIADQTEHDLLWIRRDFLNHSKPFEKRIVHGHTPAMKSEIQKNRICVDSAAYASGVLTAVRLLDGQETLIRARKPASN